MIKKEPINYKCKMHMNVYENDKIVNTIEKSNLLLKTGKLIILECLCNPTPIYGNLTSMVFGNSETVADVNDSISDFGDYHVNNTVGYNIDQTTYDNVKIYWSLSESEFNNKTLKTIGLVGNNSSYNHVFNRINLLTQEYIVKAPYIKITGYWQIFLT